MSRLTILVFAVLLAVGAEAPTAASAAAPQFSNTQLCQILQPCEPPARYRSGPFVAKPVVREVSMGKVQSICGGTHAAANGFGIMGCAQIRGGECIVHVPRNLKRELPALFDLVLAHEFGHCRGWTHRHY